MAKLSPVRSAAPDLIAAATLTVETRGEGFTDITRDVARFVTEAGADDGALLAYMLHTSASLTIRRMPIRMCGLISSRRCIGLRHRTTRLGARRRRPGRHAGAHQAMLTGISLHVPVSGGTLALGTWQGIYLLEHRARPHRREVMLQFVGSRRG